MRITLVRHGEVIEEYQGKYNGHIDIPLSKNGLTQAKELGKKLKNTNFDKVYCSDLLRAKQTLEQFGLNQEIVYSKELREKSWGIHEGKSFQEIEKEGIKYDSFEQWLNALDGEDIYLYKERIKKYFYENIFKNNTENILIVTHAGVIKTLFSILYNYSLEEAFSIKLPYSSYKTITLNL